MSDATALIIDKLSEKLGTTTEHFLGVLVQQAPVSAAIEMISIMALAAASVFLFRQARAEQNEEFCTPIWVAFFFVTCVVFFTFIIDGPLIIAAFFNPEYWALHKVLSLINK